jgi:hypothetical protein
MELKERQSPGAEGGNLIHVRSMSISNSRLQNERPARASQVLSTSVGQRQKDQTNTGTRFFTLQKIYPHPPAFTSADLEQNYRRYVAVIIHAAHSPWVKNRSGQT